MTFNASLRRLCVALVLYLGVCARAFALDPSAICDAVAETASARSGVPVSVLKAISLNETGRKRGGAFRPWAWTVNMEGAGHWFDTLEEARAYVDKEFARGARSFDVGCFQINYKWHHQEFSSLDEMFNPMANALYAARYLTELYQETGDWTKAAGAYHSRTPKYAEKYSARFEGFRNRLLGQDGPASSGTSQSYAGQNLFAPQGYSAQSYSDTGYAQDAIPEIPDIVLAANGGAELMQMPQTPRVNNYPLLQSGAGGSNGSLVPSVAALPGLLPKILVD